jgi:MoxR-like ATPase
VPERVGVVPGLRNYIVELGRRTRVDDRVEVGVSPRGTQRLFEAARAAATLTGRNYVVPDDIKQLAVPVFAHRLVLTADAEVRGATPERVVGDVIEQVEVPAVDPDAGSRSRAGRATER